jgi:hypothetical protein
MLRFMARQLFAPEAVCDALMLVGAAAHGGSSRAQVHALAYLARAIWTGSDHQSHTWGYEFVAAPDGAPFAPLLDETMGLLLAAGHLFDDRGLLGLSPAGSAFAMQLKQLPAFADRVHVVGAAGSAPLVVPFPALRRALMVADQELATAITLGSVRPLFVEDTPAHLRAQWNSICEGLGGRASMLMTAWTWMAYLASQTRGEQQR